MDKNFVVKPLKSLGKGVSALMLNRKFFDKYMQSFRNKKSLHSLVDKQVSLPIVWLDQVHGTEVHRVQEIKSKLINCTDALYTESSNLALAIKTADCLPLILANEDGSEISAIHVGWRGLYNGIIENVLSFFKSDLKKINAWLAPCISAENYMVGEDVFYSFFNSDKASISSFQEIEGKNKWFFDLKHESQRRLEKKGIKITTNSLCTYKNKEFFYSHRRDRTLGRMVTLIWKDHEK